MCFFVVVTCMQLTLVIPKFLHNRWRMTGAKPHCQFVYQISPTILRRAGCSGQEFRKCWRAKIDAMRTQKENGDTIELLKRDNSHHNGTHGDPERNPEVATASVSLETGDEVTLLFSHHDRFTSVCMWNIMFMEKMKITDQCIVLLRFYLKCESQFDVVLLLFAAFTFLCF